MGVLLPNYPEENVVKSACGENVPNYSTSTGTGTSSNVFQILQDLWLKQYQGNHPDSLQSESRTSRTSTTNMACTTAQQTPLMTYGSTTANQNTGTVTHNTSLSKLLTSSRTTMPTRTTPSTRQLTSVIPQDTPHNGHPQCCMHVHQPQVWFVSRENR